MSLSLSIYIYIYVCEQKWEDIVIFYIVIWLYCYFIVVTLGHRLEKSFVIELFLESFC